MQKQVDFILMSFTTVTQLVGAGTYNKGEWLSVNAFMPLGHNTTQLRNATVERERFSTDTKNMLSTAVDRSVSVLN